MKKLSLIIALILMCTMLFASCGVKKPNNDTSTEETVDATRQGTKPLTPEDMQQVEAVEKLVYKLAMATTVEEVESCVIECGEEYANYVLNGFPDDDYIVNAEKLIEYKGTIAFNVIVTCESDPEYIYSGVQLFSYTEEGELLIDLNEGIVEAFGKEFACPDCDGKGFIEIKAQTSGAYDEYAPCEFCNEVGFVFDKETK